MKKNENVLWYEYENIHRFIDIVKKFDKESWKAVKKYVDENIDDFQEMNQLEKKSYKKRIKLLDDLEHLKK